MRPDRDLCFSPAEANLRVMSLFFGQLANSINEFQRPAKVFELVNLSQVMIVNHSPAFQLWQQSLN
jgi:hypothetical protein